MKAASRSSRPEFMENGCRMLPETTNESTGYSAHKIRKKEKYMFQKIETGA